MKRIKKRVTAVYHLVKPEDHIDFLMSVIAVAIIANGGLYLLELNGLLLAVLFGFFILAGTIVLNQYFEIEVDRINKPHRPLPSGVIEPRTALIIVGICYTIAFILSIKLGMVYTILAIAAVVLSLSYSHPYTKIRKRSILLQVFIINAGYSILTFLIGWCVYQPISTIPIGLLLFLFLTDVGGVFVKDYRDYEGDKKHGYITLPTLLGYERAVFLNACIYLIPFFVVLLFSLISILNMRFGLLSIYCMLTGVIAFSLLQNRRKDKAVIAYYLITINFIMVRIISVWALVL